MLNDVELQGEDMFSLEMITIIPRWKLGLCRAHLQYYSQSKITHDILTDIDGWENGRYYIYG